MTVRCLHHPDRETWPETNVVPRMSSSKQAQQVRSTLGQFLDATLMRPLWFSEEQQEQRVEQALNTMTLTERITIEIQLQQREATVHSFDYDPLR